MTTSPAKLQVITPADWVPGTTQGEWTYNEYLAFPDDGKGWNWGCQVRFESRRRQGRPDERRAAAA